MTHQVVVVAGAQGALGKLVCDSLLDRARRAGTELEVRGLVRWKAGDTPRAPGVNRESAPAAAGRQRLTIIPVDYQNREDRARACEGATCVVSTLQGLSDVIVDVQSRLLEAAIEKKVRRFIPSDFSGDFTKLPVGSHRNFDLRREFHVRADELIAKAASPIEFTSVFQGAFMELLASGWVLFDYKKRSVNYFGSADAPMELTTWKNTAEFTAAVALDPEATPRRLYPAGLRLTPRQGQALVKNVTGAEFALKRVMPIGVLRVVIALMKFFRPGPKNDVMPLWVAMQYGYCGALGVMSPSKLDNERYPDIVWQGADGIIKDAFVAAQMAK